jgi:hypothetical protein
MSLIINSAFPDKQEENKRKFYFPKINIRLSSILAIMVIALWMFSCNDDKLNTPTNQSVNQKVGEFPDNPMPTGKLPPATVKLITPKVKKHSNNSILDVTPALTPSDLSVNLLPGESVSEKKNLYLPPQVTPRRGDILFCFDLTGSMGGELSNVKVNSANIMTAVQGIISDSYFGVISHKDYPNYPSTYSSCGYTSSYGYTGDYPYQMNQSITSSYVSVTNAINALSLGSGYDFPEDYTRAFYESYADGTIGFRAGTKKIVVAFLDAVPHDCAFDAIIGGSTSTGTDPGRDGIIGNADDLAILDVLNGMNASGITLITLYSGDGTYLNLWRKYSQLTGGDAFQINPDGTIPGGTDISTFIANLIQGATKQFTTISLQTCDAAYNSWLTSVVPSSYTNVSLGSDQDLGFDIKITVPDGTPDGQYCFDVCAIGDGQELAKQHVCVTVNSEIKVSIDIKPTSCPNPINIKDKGVLPVAVCGTAGFDASQIDVSTVRILGVAPTKSTIEDVATPFVRTADGCYDCTTAGGDGFKDLSLKFDIQSIITALGTHTDMECVKVELTGKLKAAYGGTPIKGSDIIRYQKK